MKIKNTVILIFVIVSLSGCAAFQAAGDVQGGREAFIIGKNEDASADFQRAAKIDPDYVTGAVLPEGVWSYLGRSEYASGKLRLARHSLERALADNKDDQVARLYLGLTLARAGQRRRGLREIQAGLTGIKDWIDYVNDAFRFSYGQYWDPTGQIRSEIKSDLAMISSKHFTWSKLISDGEWVGRKVEEEIDLAQRDESQDMSRDGDSTMMR
ncbi:MAG: tetratricopeptide repeat protein [Chloroflexota bacterium]